jgi:hypothetical protein
MAGGVQNYKCGCMPVQNFLLNLHRSLRLTGLRPANRPNAKPQTVACHVG